ncbi:ARM repeat-containing protein [Cristinia sonorae]|uniref:ARM repeat-containing protein n=1 Tax=Cristinia sonorae TaxID=1940300 RepID=A0A8K0XNJ1_9AGAR|nr:ARM repeat-containing protein [Cristinia sonorae]
MGKSQKKRQMRRHNPMRVPDSHLPHGLASASASSSKSDAILPILQKMENVDAAERKWACVAVSNLIQNDPATRRLLQGKNVVGALITRLSDSEEEVVVEAAGALRNLCIDGGYDICGEMYNKGILSPLKSFVPKLSTTLSQFLENPKNAAENVQKLVYELADNVITIFWCLSETSSKALTTINQIGLVPFLMSFLAAREKLPLSTVTSAAQCLYVLSDDNPPAINEIRADAAYTACLISIVQPEGADVSVNGKGKEASVERQVSLRVLCCGILKNISPIPPPSIAATIELDRDVTLPTLHPVLTSISLQETSATVEDLLRQQDAIPEIDKLSIKNAPKSDHKSPVELELERIELRLRTLQLSLEILTGICATLPDPEPVQENTETPQEDEDNGMDDEDEEEMLMDENTDTNDADAPSSSFLPALVSPLLPLVQPTPLSFPPPAGGLSPHPPTTSVLSAIHICALECLNNIFFSLATPKKGQDPSASLRSEVESATQVWNAIWRALEVVGTNFNQPGQERRREMWNLAVGVLWGIGIVWKGVLVPIENQIRLLIEFCDASVDQAVKVKCIGTLECLAQHPQSTDANRVISNYLLTHLPSSSRPTPPLVEPCLQALSAIIDIYSDETLPYDINFRQGGYVNTLASSMEAVRKVVRAIDRKRERELRRRGEEVRDNLVAFVEYRRGLRL